VASLAAQGLAKFGQADRYVVFRLRRLMIQKRGQNVHVGQAGPLAAPRP
jgi:hypothetical protein